ncbi:MAG TPA: sugar phosphate isomerase/epimerase family protein [bacterium]|nr:sugar phosphate isomerase/epimerase family protein [bacterium]
MRISLITDEVSADPEVAFELGREWGIADFELRGYFTDRVPMLSTYQRRRLQEMIVDYGVRITAISPGLFKIPYPAGDPERSSLGWMDRGFFDTWESSRKALQFHLDELLPRSVDYAAEVGARLIICFGFHRGGLPPGPTPAGVLDALARAADRAAAAGLMLAVETEDGFWADTGARSAQILQAIDHPGLGLNWDPANAFAAGDIPFPDGYAMVRNLVRNVHFKDARRDPDGTVRSVVDGEIDWGGQLDALVRDGYNGCIAVETHVRPRIAAARASLERLRRLTTTGHHECVNPRR